LTGVSKGDLHHKYLTSYIGAQAWPEERHNIKLKRAGSKKSACARGKLCKELVSSFPTWLARWLMGCAARIYYLSYYRLTRDGCVIFYYHAAAQNLLDATFGHRRTLREFDDDSQH
jgi:hypothetical protein